MVVYVVAGVLVGILATASVIAGYIGILGLVGALQLVRCANCGHLTATSPHSESTSCPFCRHPHRLHAPHPLAALTRRTR